MQQRALMEALRDKYQRMLTLRRTHALGVVDEPRAELRALAAEFPGALREIDVLPLTTIEARIAELTGVIDNERAIEPWMTWIVDYHGLLRAALRIKRWFVMNSRKRSWALDGDVLVALREIYVAASDEPAVETIDVALVGAILKPPQGRLSPWVMAQIAARHGVSVDDVRAQLFPTHERHR